MYHEKITSRRDLAEVLSDQLDSISDESSVYVDLTAQEVFVHVPVEYTGVTDEEYDGHEVVRMEPFNSNEGFDVMEDFARSRPDALANPLLKALSKSHPFKMFRYALEDSGQLQDWYAFKNKAYADLAEARLEECCIDVVDGKIVCGDKSVVTIYEAECTDGDEDE